jgi:hypothetical protein
MDAESQLVADLEDQVKRLQQLITELADALVDNDYVWYNEGDELIQRARKEASNAF